MKGSDNPAITTINGVTIHAPENLLDQLEIFAEGRWPNFPSDHTTVTIQQGGRWVTMSLNEVRDLIDPAFDL